MLSPPVCAAKKCSPQRTKSGVRATEIHHFRPRGPHRRSRQTLALTQRQAHARPSGAMQIYDFFPGFSLGVVFTLPPLVELAGVKDRSPECRSVYDHDLKGPGILGWEEVIGRQWESIL